MRAVWLNVCAYFEIFPLFAVITIRVVTQKKQNNELYITHYFSQK